MAVNRSSGTYSAARTEATVSTNNRSAALGVQPHITDRTMPVRDITRLADERGYASIFVCEHTHIPVSSKSISPRGILPDWCKHIPDPYVTLAAVAATSELEIGTAVGLVAQHDPIVLAKTIATLDQLCGGRFVFGVGWGWNREEFHDHTRLPAKERLPVLRDKLALMRRIWTDEEAEYDGPYVSVSRSWSWPKPTRSGGPPVLIGSSGEARNLERVVDWADGWIPMYTALSDELHEQFVAQLSELRQLWEGAGRDPDLLDVTVLHPPGDRDAVRRALDRADALGVRRVLIQLVEEQMADAESHLDKGAAAFAGR